MQTNPKQNSQQSSLSSFLNISITDNSAILFHQYGIYGSLGSHLQLCMFWTVLFGMISSRGCSCFSLKNPGSAAFGSQYNGNVYLQQPTQDTGKNFLF
jgi:hypothetical protein